MSFRQRRAAIEQLVRQRGGVAVRELGEHFGVSRMTINRDLRYLEQQGRIARIHGGLFAPAGMAATRAGCCERCSRLLLSHLQVQWGSLAGGERSYCCPTCAFVALAGASPPEGLVRDFISGRTLAASEAYYLLNSMAMPCCQPSILAFAEEAQLNNFRLGFGGAVGRLDEARAFIALERRLAGEG